VDALRKQAPPAREQGAEVVNSYEEDPVGTVQELTGGMEFANRPNCPLKCLTIA
jgi:hypothetical protein